MMTLHIEKNFLKISLDHLQTCWQLTFKVPDSIVTIDEAVMLLKGSLSFKQFMKDKPTKWGKINATNRYAYYSEDHCL